MGAQVNDEQRRGFLRDEYLFLQAQYEDYDKRALSIRGWVLAGATGLIALGFNKSYVFSPAVPLSIAVLVMVVWYTEICWKVFQYALTDRINVIEAYFRDDPEVLDKDPAPVQIYRSWCVSFEDDRPVFDFEMKTRPRPRWKRYMNVARQPFVSVPYLVVLAICLFLAGYLVSRT